MIGRASGADPPSSAFQSRRLEARKRSLLTVGKTAVALQLDERVLDLEV